jgi:parallel beta-helix repeat protein
MRRVGYLLAAFVLATRLCLVLGSGVSGAQDALVGSNSEARARSLIQVGTRPGVPPGLKAIATTYTRITLTWNASAGATSYRIFRNNNFYAGGVNNLFYVDPAVNPGNTYSYYVQACNSNGCSGASNTVTVASPSASCVGVAITTSTNIQDTINLFQSGTTFCFAAGTYHLTNAIVPKSNDVLKGAPGAVLTGDNATKQAIRFSSAQESSVTVKGFLLEYFVGDTTAVTAAIKAGNRWQVLNNEVAFNAHTALTVATGGLVKGNYIHDNTQWATTGYRVDGTTIQGNEFARNGDVSTFKVPYTGTIKFLFATNLTISGNYIHDNKSHVIHCDTDCRYVTYDGNTVVKNSGIGIFHEDSYDAVISNNVLRNNDYMLAGKSLSWGANIFVNDASNVEVYGNYVESSVPSLSVNGIGLYDYSRGSGEWGVYEIANDSVHDNVIKMHNGGVSGLVGSAHNPTTLNNHFEHNAYYVDDTAGQYWSWVTFPLSWSQWRSKGQDSTGSLTKWA